MPALSLLLAIALGPAFDNVAELAHCWMRKVTELPDPSREGVKVRGLAGQLFLFNDDSKPVSRLTGSVTVEMFDVKPGVGSRQLGTWKFDKNALSKLATENGRFGKCYFLFLPCPDHDLIGRCVQLKARYDPERGSALQAIDSTITLEADEDAPQKKPEPRYEGKPLSYWLEKFQKAETDDKRREAVKVVEAFGPDAAAAVPALVEMLYDHSPTYRYQVAQMLCAIGPTAKSAVPDLIKMLEMNPPRAPDEVIQVLCAIGPEAKPAIPAIRKVVLDQFDPKPRKKPLDYFISIGRLHELGPESAPLLAELVRLRRDQPEDITIHDCISGLGKLGAEAKAAAPELRPLLKHKEPGIRLSAARALWSIEKNKEVIPVLLALVNAEYEDLVTPAVIALGEIGPAAKDALATLKPLVKKEENSGVEVRSILRGEFQRGRAEFQQALQDAIRKIDANSKK